MHIGKFTMHGFICVLLSTFFTVVCINCKRVIRLYQQLISVERDADGHVTCLLCLNDHELCTPMILPFNFFREALISFMEAYDYLVLPHLSIVSVLSPIKSCFVCKIHKFTVRCEECLMYRYCSLKCRNFHREEHKYKCLFYSKKKSRCSVCKTIINLYNPNHRVPVDGKVETFLCKKCKQMLIC